MNSMREVIDLYDQLLKFEDYLNMSLPEQEIIHTGNGNFKMCCPLHGETVPSFLFNEKLGHWTCFGACNTSGKTVKFHHMWLQKQYGEQVSMSQAIRHLQGMYAHLLPKWDPKGRTDYNTNKKVIENPFEDFNKEIKLVDNKLDFNNKVLRRFLS